MIHNYSDHAANERTFLAWVRTGLAVTAFGIVIEKFNIFMSTVASSVLGGAARGLESKLSQPFGRYEGLAFIFGGVALIVLATVRFARTTRLIDDPQAHSAKGLRLELILSAALVLMVASYSVFLALD